MEIKRARYIDGFYEKFVSKGEKTLVRNSEMFIISEVRYTLSGNLFYKTIKFGFMSLTSTLTQIR